MNTMKDVGRVREEYITMKDVGRVREEYNTKGGLGGFPPHPKSNQQL